MSVGEHAPREELRRAMDTGLERVYQLAEAFGELRLSTMTDPAGWTGLDHLHHLNAWERSLISWLNGGTRAAGLGIEESIWETRDIAAINNAVRAAHPSPSLEAILVTLAENRRLLGDLVSRMSDEELRLPYSHFPPEVPSQIPPSVASRILRVVGSHVDDHLGYIRAMSVRGT